MKCIKQVLFLALILLIIPAFAFAGLTDLQIGAWNVQGATAPDGSGSYYFVDGNSGSDGNDGKSWATAYKTLTVAFAASHANIASASDRWARRNTIYIAGDRFDEDLVAFPQKTDVIGVGSCDAYPMPGISGNHAPVNTHYSTRFINIRFEPGASSDIVTLTSSGSGCEFDGCVFVGVFGSYTAPSAIDATAHPLLRIRNCRFEGAFSGDVIDIGAGDASGTEIVGNTIVGGADNGIVITEVATVAGMSSRGVIADNYIEVADKVIDTRAESVFNCIGNRCISGEALGASSYVLDLTYACDNMITGNDAAILLPDIANF